MDDFVRWNNNVVSARSCHFSLLAVPYFGFQTLDYEDELDVEIVGGNNRNGAPIGMTSGEYKVTGFSFGILKDVWIVKMLPQLAAISAAQGKFGSYGGEFTFTAQYQEGPVVGTDMITGCRVVGSKTAYAKGTGAMVEEVKCAAMTIRRNGLTLFDQARFP